LDGRFGFKLEFDKFVGALMANFVLKTGLWSPVPTGLCGQLDQGQFFSRPDKNGAYIPHMFHACRSIGEEENYIGAIGEFFKGGPKVAKVDIMPRQGSFVLDYKQQASAFSA
jgi:hypothetical protein